MSDFVALDNKTFGVDPNSEFPVMIPWLNNWWSKQPCLFGTKLDKTSQEGFVLLGTQK